MLADVLDGARDQLAEELERRPVSGGGMDSAVAGARRHRVRTLVQELAEALRRGGVDDPAQPFTPLTPTPDQAGELRERELVQHYLIRQIEQKRLESSPRETAIVAGWAEQADLKRV